MLLFPLQSAGGWRNSPFASHLVYSAWQNDQSFCPSPLAGSWRGLTPVAPKAHKLSLCLTCRLFPYISSLQTQVTLPERPPPPEDASCCCFHLLHNSGGLHKRRPPVRTHYPRAASSTQLFATRDLRFTAIPSHMLKPHSS